MCSCIGKFSCNIHILLQKFPLYLQIFALSKLWKTLKPCFFDDFGAWRSPPSATLQERQVPKAQKSLALGRVLIIYSCLGGKKPKGDFPLSIF